MKKILAAIIILAAFTGISHANIVYTTSNGYLGVIPVSSTTSIDTPVSMYLGIVSDSVTGSYSVGTSHYVMVVERRAENESGDRALVFSTSDLSSPVLSADLEGINDTKTFGGSYNGRSLFFASGKTPSIE